MIGAAAFIVTNIAFWGAISLNVPDFSWPTATLLSLPFAFIVGQLAEGLAAWKGKAKPQMAALRGAVLGLGVAIVLIVTQFFGTLYIQPSDWPYAMLMALGMLVIGAALTVVGDLAPSVALELVGAVRAVPHHAAVTSASAEETSTLADATPAPIDAAPVAAQRTIPSVVAAVGRRGKSTRARPAEPRNRRSVWS